MSSIARPPSFFETMSFNANSHISSLPLLTFTAYQQPVAVKSAKMLLVFFGLFASLFAKGKLSYAPNVLHPFDSALINLQKYDSTVRPPGIDDPQKPINVTVNFFLRDIFELNHETQEFRVQLTFRQEWTDTRLAFKNYDREVRTTEVQLFWLPDIFFSNEFEGHLHTITKPNNFISISNSGKILHSTRITLSLKCPMHLGSFPFDSQTCSIRMPSYAYTTDDILLQWRDDDPIQVSSWPEGMEYTLTSFEPTDCTSYTNTGAYGCLLARFHFARDPSSYIVRTFLPLNLLVLASWTQFWLPSSALVLRLSVAGLTTITTLAVTMYERDYLRVPTLCVLDVWMSTTVLFVFAAFFELILVSCWGAKKNDGLPATDDVESQKNKILWLNFPTKVPYVDALARVFFPSSYTIFNLLFIISFFSFGVYSSV